MQWLLTAVVLGAACWMVSALTYQEDEGTEGERSRLLEGGGWDSISRLATSARTTLGRWSELAGSALVRFVRLVGPPIAASAKATASFTMRVLRTTAAAVWTVVRAVAVTLAYGGRLVGTNAARAWSALRSGATELGRARSARARPRRRQTARPAAVPFERSFILTGPEESAVGVALPTFNGSAKRPSALTRLLAFVQLVFLVVLWGSGAALAIAGAAWAVTRIV